MEARGPLKETAAWKRLEAFYAEQGSSLSIPAMFQADPDRFSKFSRRLETPKDGPFLVDFSKVRSWTMEQKFVTKNVLVQCRGSASGF
jgi:glucose-6-phosphate isomerase